MKMSISHISLLLCFFLAINSFGQQTTSASLIQRIKADSEWNTINYFEQIDKVVASKSSDEDKVTLLLLKANYFANVEKFKDALSTIEQAEKKLPSNPFKDSIQAIIHLRKSGYYANQNQFFEAYREWVKCNNYYLLNKKYNGLSYAQQVLGIFLLKLNQKESSYKAFLKAKKYALIQPEKRVLADLYRSISTYWAMQNNMDSSLHYFSLGQSYGAYKEIDLTADYNKGVLYYQKGDMENARLFFQKTVNDAKKVKCFGYEGVGKYGLAITYIGEDSKKAFRLMQESLSLIDYHNPDLGINICKCVLENFSGKEYETLLPFFEKRRHDLTEDKKNLDQIQVGKLFNVSSEMNDELLSIQVQLEQKQLAEAKREKQVLLLSVIGGGILVVLVAVLFLYGIIIKSRRLLREQNAQQKRVLNNSIVTITNYNAMTEGVTHKLKQLALQQPNKKLSDELYAISRNIGELAVGAKSKELKDLDLVIQSINDGFVKKLCTKFPTLSSGDITLAIYLRMNFTTKQIAELKGASENSIDVARSRLRSKLGLKGENVDLTLFMNRI